MICILCILSILIFISFILIGCVTNDEMLKELESKGISTEFIGTYSAWLSIPFVYLICKKKRKETLSIFFWVSIICIFGVVCSMILIMQLCGELIVPTKKTSLAAESALEYTCYRNITMSTL